MSNLERAGIEDHNQRFQGLWFGAFDAHDNLEGVAAHFWNNNILMQCPDPHILIPLLDALRAASARPLGGLLGPWPQLEHAHTHFAVDLDACSYAQREPLYALDTDALTSPFLSDDPTRVRLATHTDLELVTDWTLTFNRILQPDMTRDAVARSVQANIETQNTWLLEDRHTGEPLSTTSNNATIHDIFQVGGVYTPAHSRGNGYARRVVAGQIEAMRARGFTRVILFTGEENIPAQRAYASLGFIHTLDYGLILGIPETSHS